MSRSLPTVCRAAALFALLAPALAPPVLAGAPVNLIVVTTTADGLDNSDGKCSLREALRNANTNSAYSLLVGECPAGSSALTDEIVLVAGQTYALTVPGNGNDEGDLNILPGPASVDLRIRSSQAGVRALIQQQVPGQRVMAIHGARVELTDVSIQGGSTTAIGGGIFSVQAHVTLRNTQVANNSANHGGGINNSSGMLLIHDSEIEFNQAQLEGGGIHHLGDFTDDAPSLIISGGRVASNTAQRGGGLFNDSDWVRLRDEVEFTGNSATAGDGGGVLSNVGYVEGVNAHFFGNTASGNGGGLAAIGDETSLELEGGFVHGNQATRGGGAYVNPTSDLGVVQVRNVDLRNNSASDRGGALYGVNTWSTGSHFENNSAAIGGALYATEGVGFSDSEAAGNTATSNGGAIRGRYLTIHRSLFRDNVANQGDGGAIWAERRFNVYDTTVQDNTAGRHGGGLYLHGQADGTHSYIRRSAFARNLAANQGGGLWLYRNGEVNLANTTISGNLAAFGGGVYLEEGTTLRAVHMTLTGNQIGLDIYKMGTLILGNSILGTPSQPSCVVSLDNLQIQSLGHNLTTDPLCFGLDQPGDQLVSDPMLAALADNGGNTLTHALLDGSPARNAADLDLCMDSGLGGGTDQRRGERPVGAGCDIGAYEHGAIVDRIFRNGFQVN